MSLARLCASIPAVLLTCACALGSAGLVGCYDLSTTGPHPEDFQRTPGGDETQAQGPIETRAANPADEDDSHALVAALGNDPTPEAAAAPLTLQQPPTR